MTTAQHRTQPPAPGSALTAPASLAVQKCINPDCGAEHGVERVLTTCPACGELLDIVYDWSRAKFARDFSWFTRPGAGAECSGVWQFRDLLPFYRTESDIVSVGEGKTILQRADVLAERLGFGTVGGLYLQYEGMNPSGSFKDNGMTAGFTHARMVGAKAVACASTGNTSASLALYASASGLKAFVFVGEGRIAFGKLSQALDFGATTIQVAGDFDTCLARVREIAERAGSPIYLLNSVNPFRLEGQKTIMYRVMRDLGWKVPDWIVVPGGNLGNCSAFGKAFAELRDLGLIDRLPRLAVINASGARTLDRVYTEQGVRWNGGRYDRAKVKAEHQRMDDAGERAHTIASAIEINRPVNLSKALRALDTMANERGRGVVRSVDDETILEYKALVGRHGYGCEPASAASVAGAHRLLQEGVIRPDETVVCILTGHQLKDPDATVTYHTGIDTKAAQEHIPASLRREPTGRHANQPIKVEDTLEAILGAMGV